MISEQGITYPQWLYMIQYWLSLDTGSYFSGSEKEDWLRVLPDIWQSCSEQETIRMHDVVRRLGHVVGKEGVHKLVCIMKDYKLNHPS
jgi:hypothetical protein